MATSTSKVISSKFSSTSTLARQGTGLTLKRNNAQGNNMNEPRNVIIKDVTFFWVKCDKPVDNYAGDALQWEVQVRVPAKRSEELSIYGKIKEQDDGTVSYNFHKKAFKADGSPAVKVRVVGSDKEPIDSKSIGNGSKGNILLMLKDYEIKNQKTGKVTKSGTSSMVTAIQVKELKEYVPTGKGNFVDFDDEEDTPTAKPSKAKASKKNEDFNDDDIPF